MSQQQLGKKFYDLIDLGYRPSQAFSMLVLCTPELTNDLSTWLFNLVTRCEQDTITWPSSDAN